MCIETLHAAAAWRKKIFLSPAGTAAPTGAAVASQVLLAEAAILLSCRLRPAPMQLHASAECTQMCHALRGMQLLLACRGSPLMAHPPVPTPRGFAAALLQSCWCVRAAAAGVVHAAAAPLATACACCHVSWRCYRCVTACYGTAAPVENINSSSSTAHCGLS